MTWGEFKRKVEEKGLKVEDEILQIVWPSGSLEKNGEIKCYRNEFGWEIVAHPPIKGPRKEERLWARD